MLARLCRWSATALVVSAVLSAALADPPTGGSSTGPGSAALEQTDWLKASEAQADPDGSTVGSVAPPSQDKPWEVKFKVYNWIPNYHGTAGAMGHTSTLDVSCNDVFHTLDEVSCMVPINLEARYGRWGMIADLFYIRIKDSVTTGGIEVDSESTQTILELGGFYRAGTWPVGPDDTGSVTLDVLAGARYNRLSGNVGLTTADAAVSIGGAQEWWDPFVGPRVTWQASEKLALSLRGDVGGFGITNCSDFVGQIIAAAEYRITEHFFTELGYRLLDTDYERGSGSTRVVYDVTMCGPYLTLGVRF